MARGPTYRVPFRRRREGRTDYHHRLRLLRSGKPRLVIGKSSRHMRAQLIMSGPEGDETKVSAISSTLAKYGYKGYTGNVPAAYLTGLLMGLKAAAEGYEEAVLDMGLHSSTRGSRVYAALKGALDAGLIIPCDETVLPDEERIIGGDSKSFESVKNNMLSEIKG